MINCYTGNQYDQIKAWYFESLPVHIDNIEAQQKSAIGGSGGPFFGGSTPSHADFNVYHHFANARLVVPQCIPDSYSLSKWMDDMEALPTMVEYLEERPQLVG